ncbi:MAG: type II toxin-antitoxin system RelE family toxin [Luteolibacter sp.]
MDSFRIEWRKSTRKDLRKIDRQVVPRIIDAVEALAENPYPAGSTKLTGSENAYRIRVGDYRVLYEIYDEELVVEVVKAGHRRDVYR